MFNLINDRAENIHCPLPSIFFFPHRKYSFIDEHMTIQNNGQDASTLCNEV